MSTSKTKKTAAAAPQDVASTLSGILAQITTPALSTADRKKMEARNTRTPDALIAMIVHLAEQDGSTVAGMPFDAAGASAVLSSTEPTTISVCRQLLQRMEDDWTQQRLTVADPAFAIYQALARLVNTPAGNSLKPAYEQMKAIVKNRPPKTNRKKQPKTATAGASSTQPAAAAGSASSAGSTATRAAQAVVNGAATAPSAAALAATQALPPKGSVTVNA